MPPEPPEPTDLFTAMGGSAKCVALSKAFYARVARDPTLRPLFPGKTFRCAIEELSAFLAQFLGGPSGDTQYRWWLSLRESHLRFPIGQQERDAWIENMTTTLGEIPMDESMRSALQDLFEQSSAYLINKGPAAPARKRRTNPEMELRWEEQQALDEAVAAVRAGDIDRVIASLAGPLLQCRFHRSPAVFANFAGILIGSGHPAMADYALKILLENPALSGERYSGRSLLHAASAAGNLPIVELLLKSGVDPGVQDRGGHTPLYSVGNECPGGGAVVKTLVQAGAAVDACDGVKRCTALHMAARRGNVEAAEALLACGANLEARDSLGDTPLRRAVNCAQPAVAALLLAKGADRHSIGSKGLTPRSAARSGAMRNVLASASRG